MEQTESLSPNEAGAAVSAAISEARSEGISAGVDIAGEAIAEANRRVEQTEEMASRIAEAALETERGNRIAVLEAEFSSWRDALAGLQASLSELQTQISGVRTSQAALVGMEIQEALSSTPALSPTPIISEPLAEAAEVAEVIPEALAQSAVAESPAPQIKVKARRLI